MVILYLVNSLFETLVSSTAINWTSDKTSNALVDISDKLPIGVPMIYKAPFHYFKILLIDFIIISIAKSISLFLTVRCGLNLML